MVVDGRQDEHYFPVVSTYIHLKPAAEKALPEVLAVLKLSGRELEQMPKSAPEKAVLAWWLRQRTTVPMHWVSEHLSMGDFTWISQAIGEVKRQPERKHEQIGGILNQMAHRQTAP